MKKLQSNENGNTSVDFSQFKALYDSTLNEIETIKYDIAAVEEKYHKMMLEESAELNQKLEKYQKALDGIQALMDLFGNNEKEVKEDNPEMKSDDVLKDMNTASSANTSSSNQEITVTANESDEKEPVIQDTLFPENNDTSSDESDKSEIATPTSHEEVVQADSNEFNFDNEEKKEEADNSNDEWPDLPDDWK